MNYEMSNNLLNVTIKSEGAELVSLTSKDEIHYLWNGDQKYWKRHAPILFPIVGKVIEDQYSHQGERYALSQHGFARDQQFKVEEQTETSITFCLEASQETLKVYPFRFRLKVRYELKGLKVRYELKGNQVDITYEVYNQDEKDMYFSIGAHPAFNCPLLEGETMEDYYIEFEQEEDATYLGLTEEVLLSGATTPFKGKQIGLSPALFENGAIILSNLKSKYATLKSNKHNYSVKVLFEEFPFLGIWSPEKGAPFVCIEPWIGHTDYIDDSTLLKDKKDMIILAPQKVFKASHSLVIE